jgi:hypothetical protein
MAERKPNKASPRVPARAGSSPTKISAVEQMMHALLLFLMDAGWSRDEVAQMLARALAGAYAARAEAEGLRNSSTALSGVLFAWHRERRHVDATARPRPLRLRGPRDSVESLIRECGDAKRVDSVLRALISQGLIRRTAGNRYLPANHVATLRSYGPELGGYVGEAILNLMETIQDNLRPEYGGDTLIERAALIRDLPPRLSAQFKSFTQEQGSALIANVDEWLESHRAARTAARRGGARSPGGPRRGVTAGVHVFAFLSNRRR